MDNPFSNSKSFFDDIVNALAGRGYIDGSTWLQQPQTQADGPPMPDNQPTGSVRHMAPHHANPNANYGSPMPSVPVGWQDKALPQAPWGRMIPFQESGLAIQQQIPGSAPMVAQGFQPANLGNVPQVPPIQQPMQGSAQALPQGFRPFNIGFNRQPSLLEMLLTRRG